MYQNLCTQTLTDHTQGLSRQRHVKKHKDAVLHHSLVKLTVVYTVLL